MSKWKVTVDAPDDFTVEVEAPSEIDAEAWGRTELVNRASVTATEIASPVYDKNNPPDANWHLYADSSHWNAPIDRTKVDPRSAEKVRKLVTDSVAPTSTVQNRQNWGIPIYFGSSADPAYTITAEMTGQPTAADINRKTVRCPIGAAPASASDGVVLIIDQERGEAFRLQNTTISHSNRSITCSRGFRLGINGDGFETADGTYFDTIAPTMPQPIRPEELAVGYVNHTMSFGTRCLSVGPVSPFTKSLTRGKNPCGDDERLRMGNVIFLDMTHAQIDALNKPVWIRAVLKGLADHGALVGLNNSGDSWALKFESQAGRTVFGKPDPYAALGLPATMDFRNALDSVGGWGAKLKVLAPFAR